MVQQPVIQLVQELTMTAVVERHDCTDTKKEEKINKSQAPFEYKQCICLSKLPSLKITLI